MHEGIETAKQLDLLGYPTLLVRPAPDKNPVHTGWPKRVLTDGEIDSAFDRDPEHGIGLKLGGPDGLIDIEGDGPGAEQEWAILTEGLDVPDTLGWTSERGIHRIFKLPPDGRAQVGEGKFTHNDLEFRLGRAGEYKLYSIVPPHCDRAWFGSPFDDVAELPDVLAQRIAALRTNPIPTNRPAVTPELEDTPGNLFNKATTWEEILTGDGWTNVGSRKDGTTDWMRPGGTQISATTNYWGDDKLYLFTTNHPPLEAEASYTRFAYLAKTQWGGNFADCASYLARSGFSTQPDPVDQFDDLPADEPADDDSDMPAKLTPEDVVFPGFVEDFVNYCETATHRSDPVQSAVVGFSILATLAGRKVKTQDGTRPNLASLVLGKTGCGKTESVNVGRDILRAVHLAHLEWGGFKSSQAFDDCISQPGNQIMLILLEEFQEKVANVDPKRDKYQSEFYSALKEAMTASNSAYRGRTGTTATSGAGSMIDQPSVSLLLTGIPNQFWQHVTPELMNGGFMGRLWVVELGDLKPCRFDLKPDHALRQRLVDYALHWADDEKIADLVADDENQREVHITGRTGESEKLRIEFLKEIEAEIMRASKANDDSQSAWNRASEFFSKMELLSLASRDPSCSAIRGDDTKRAAHLTRRAIEIKGASMDQCHGMDPVVEKATRAVLRFLQRRAEDGKKVCTYREVMRGAHVDTKLFSEVQVEAKQKGLLCSDMKIAPDGQRIGMAGRFFCLPKYKKDLKKRIVG